MKPLALALFCLVQPAVAQDDATMRLAGRMAFPQPQLAKPGACVMYREGGAGWILTEPMYWLRGTVVSAEIRNQRVERCPDFGKPLTQLSREEFNRLASQQPCVSRDDLAREESRGYIRFKVEGWETPYGRKMANAGRLYEGHFLDRKLDKGVELEVDATLLGACS